MLERIVAGDEQADRDDLGISIKTVERPPTSWKAHANTVADLLKIALGKMPRRPELCFLHSLPAGAGYRHFHLNPP